FRDAKEEYTLRINNFLMQYIKNNIYDTNKVNLIVDIARHSKNDIFEEILLYYISLNQNVEQFKMISWRGNFTTSIGDGNLGDIEAADWRKILSIVDKSNIGFKLIPIKRYLNERIESCLEYAESERKRKFLGYF
ncbi:MAG: ATP-binding protein, partial [Cyanobacteria bacterium J06555_3]